MASRPTSSHDIPHILPAGLHKEYHPNSSKSRPGGRNLLQVIDETDNYREERAENIHYPFASCDEWQLANWLSGASLSQSDITFFLRLNYVRHCFFFFCIVNSIYLALEQGKPTQHQVSSRFAKLYQRTPSLAKLVVSRHHHS